MKIAILIGAALLGTAEITATPAEAQRWGDRDDRGDRWDGRDRDWRDGRNWRGHRRSYGWNGNRNWNRGYGWNGNRGWGRDRGRLVCRTYRDYYGPVRRCFRVNR